MTARRVEDLQALVLCHALELLRGSGDERERHLQRIGRDARLDALAVGGTRRLADEWARTLIDWVRTVAVTIECGDRIGRA